MGNSRVMDTTEEIQWRARLTFDFTQCTKSHNSRLSHKTLKLKPSNPTLATLPTVLVGSRLGRLEMAICY